MASRVDRGIALPFLDRGIRRGWVVNSTPQPHFAAGKDPVPIVQEAGWDPGQVWTVENLAPPGFDSRTVQPVVSRYSDWATRPAVAIYTTMFLITKDPVCLWNVIPFRCRIFWALVSCGGCICWLPVLLTLDLRRSLLIYLHIARHFCKITKSDQ
jgi:hypothetical protein